MPTGANDGTGPGARQPWLTLIGLGEGGLEELVPPARRALEQAETVFGGARHLDRIPEVPGQERIAWPSPLTDTLPWIESRRGRRVAVLASGDPFWFGIGATLARRLAPEEMAAHPAPSAFSLAAARLGWPLQESVCLSLHGRTVERVHPWLQPGARLLILSWDGSTPAALARRLVGRGFGDSTLTVLERLGAPDEGRREVRAGNWGEDPVDPLNTIAVTCRARSGARVIPRAPGRSEDAFAHDGQITKREVRASVLAHLAPRSGELLWDIGAGSGAIGIEWMLADPANRAVAVEPRPDRVERIAANARELGVPDLECVVGRAPEALSDLSAPDAVFLGGGLTTPGVLEGCVDALRPGGRLVATAVSLEGEAALTEAQAHHRGQLVRLSVERAEPLGDFRGWSPLRAVTLWSWERA